MRSLLHLARYQNGRAFGSQELGQVGVPIVRIRQLVDPAADIDYFDGYVHPRNVIDNGDLIFSWSGSLVVRLWDRGQAALNQHLFKVLPAYDVDKRWLRWVLEGSMPRFLGLMHGSAMTHLTSNMLRDVKVDVPSLDEQRRIADFLDDEMDHISKASSAHQRLRATLAERRFAFVHHAVTGAHIPRARVASDLGWLSSLPSGWRTVPLKYVAKLGSGHTPSRTVSEYWKDCNIPWISLFDVGRMRDVRQECMTNTSQQISELGMANSSACLHPAGTVVLSRTASVGFSTIMGTNMAVSQHFVTWTCGPRLLPEYLLFLLRSMSQYFESVQVGTTNVTVFMPDLHSIRIPLPSVVEQRSIVEEIHTRTGRIDALDDVLKRQIALLEERRQALVTAAVNGQVGVTTTRGVEV
ncbi:restriction endonuclease subunit S [Micromonospora sp. NPDC049175]|uniref:restriction endonuclease subunit S n=1 Tax=Micromonospora sp. NPDC049175 TaxID=3364266 RepID=UPI00371C933F